MKKEFIIERQGKSFVLYAGLLEEAHGQGLREISTSLVQAPSPENGNVAIAHAVVETEKGRFSGLGDASPANVSQLMQVHLIRMAETRAKARALRDAVNVGVAALEELAEDESTPHRAANGSYQSGPSAAAKGGDIADVDHGADNVTAITSTSDSRGTGARGATEKQLKAIYAIAQSGLHMAKFEVDAKCQDIYGYAPQDLSRWEASQFIDLLKQDKVA